MSYYKTSGEGDNPPNEFDGIDFNPNDPDEQIVAYDLRAWAADDQAELAAALAEAGVPHAWADNSELLVPEVAEGRADEIVNDLEVRLGVNLAPTIDLSVPLADNEPSVEYDLAEWPDDDRTSVARAIEEGFIRYRWEGSTLVVAAADEATIDDLLDAVEHGEVVGDLDGHSTPAGVDGDGATGEELPFETLSTFFLAGDRLARNPLDADGLTHLLGALDVADPANPPYGVDRGLWVRTCGLADQLADSLGEGDSPDVDTAAQLAAQLRDLLRTSV